MAAPIRLAYLASHPIQYQAPMLRYIVEHSDIQLKAFFLSDLSVREYYDEEFRVKFTWDVPLLEGYDYEFLPAIGGRHSIERHRPFTYGIRPALARGSFDALWLHGYSHHANLRALLAARSLGVKTFVRSDVQLATAIRRPLTGKLKESLVRWIFRRVDGFFAVGALNRDYYLHYGAPPERVFLMPYAVDNAFFQEKCRQCRPNRDRLRAELGLEEGRPVILFASKFTKRKRAMDVLEAYVRMSPCAGAEPRPYLLFVGDGEERAAVEARACRTGWSSVKFLGFKNQTELPALYDLCDVFVLVSEREPYGLIVNEVMNAAKPVIVSDQVGAGLDLVREGENGFTVRVGDVESLARRLADVTSDPARAQAMGAKSLELIDKWSYRENLEVLEHALRVVVRP